MPRDRSAWQRATQRKKSLAKPLPSARSRVTINICGRRFEVDRKTLEIFPDTRLYWLISRENLDDYDAEKDEYFFDRHAGAFEFILNYYRTGKLHMPCDICGALFAEELEYWGIDDSLMEPCCYSTYRKHFQAQAALERMRGDIELYEEGNDDEDTDFELSAPQRNPSQSLSGVGQSMLMQRRNSFFESQCWSTTKTRANAIAKTIWHTIDEPKNGTGLHIYSIISFLFVVTAISVFCLETVRTFRIPLRANGKNLLSNLTTESPHPTIVANVAAGHHFVDLHKVPYKEYLKLSEPHPALTVLDYICQVFFTLEIATKLIVCPASKRRHFVKSPLFWADVISVIPAYLIPILIYGARLDPKDSVIIDVVKSLKMMRILLIFKLAKRFTGLKVLIHTFAESASELALVVVIIIPGVLFSGVLIFYAETIFGSAESGFDSIPIGFWWASVTMTTVGYGDFYPKTLGGYLVGILCLLIGVLVVGLPIPVIVNNFTLYYDHAKALEKMRKRPRAALLANASNQLKHRESTFEKTSGSGKGPLITGISALVLGPAASPNFMALPRGRHPPAESKKNSSPLMISNEIKRYPASHWLDSEEDVSQNRLNNNNIIAHGSTPQDENSPVKRRMRSRKTPNREDLNASPAQISDEASHRYSRSLDKQASSARQLSTPTFSIETGEQFSSPSPNLKPSDNSVVFYCESSPSGSNSVTPSLPIKGRLSQNSRDISPAKSSLPSLPKSSVPTTPVRLKSASPLPSPTPLTGEAATGSFQSIDSSSEEEDVKLNDIATERDSLISNNTNESPVRSQTISDPIV